MECKRCGNTDVDYIYKGHRGIYCRKCVTFKRLLLDEEIKPFEYEINEDISEYNFDYPLTTFQEEISIKTLEYLKEGNDILLNCVCGSGKTEIVVRSISYYLERGLKVAYAISRKEVVKELFERFRKTFPMAKVEAVYGCHHENLVADLLVCTTHQLFRYYKTFDLLILDEVDAFPLSGNKELMNIAINSSKGNIVFSTATVNDFVKQYVEKRKYKELNLYVRPSLKPLIVPKCIYLPKTLLYIYLFYLLRKMSNQCIVFVNSKKECKYLYKIFNLFFSCIYVYSGLENENKNIIDFKDKKYKFIFSTTILERGITIKNINVIILEKNSGLLKEENIIQMLGRVGRNFNNPYGESYILSTKKTKAITKAINNIKEANNKYEMYTLR